MGKGAGYVMDVSQQVQGVGMLTSNKTMMSAYIMTKDEHDFFTEAKNMIADMANDEKLSPGYREQARRMLARLVLKRI